MPVVQSTQHETSEETAGAEDQWTQDFIKQAADQFEKNLQNLMQNGDDIKASCFIVITEFVAQAGIASSELPFKKWLNL